MNELAAMLFDPICHQAPGRSWAPAGEVLAVCQRCSGVYLGLALASAILLLKGPGRGRLTQAVHGLFVLQVIPFGYHWLPQDAMVRTLSGQLFALGLVYCFAMAAGMGQLHERRPAWPYWVAVLGSLMIVQLLIRAPYAFTASLLDATALTGLLCLVAWPVAVLVRLVRAWVEKQGGAPRESDNLPPRRAAC